MAFRARLVIAGNDGTNSDASLGLLSLGLDVCPFRASAGPLSVSPCAGVDAGAVSARARNVAQPTTGTAASVDAAVRGRAELALGSRVGVSTEVAGSVGLVRPRFYVDPPGKTVAQAGPFGGEVLVSMWVSFP